VFKDTRRVGDGRRKEKEVNGAGGGSEIFSRFDGYDARERTTEGTWEARLFFVFIPHKRDLYTLQ
jgi:hypothetical protein